MKCWNNEAHSLPFQKCEPHFQYEDREMGVAWVFCFWGMSWCGVCFLATTPHLSSSDFHNTTEISPGAISILLGPFPCRLRGKLKDGNELSMEACIFTHSRAPADHQNHRHPFIVGKKLRYHQVQQSVLWQKHHPSLKTSSNRYKNPLDLAHNFEQFQELPRSIYVSSAWLMDLRCRIPSVGSVSKEWKEKLKFFLISKFLKSF